MTNSINNNFISSLISRMQQLENQFTSQPNNNVGFQRKSSTGNLFDGYNSNYQQKSYNSRSNNLFDSMNFSNSSQTNPSSNLFDSLSNPPVKKSTSTSNSNMSGEKPSSKGEVSGFSQGQIGDCVFVSSLNAMNNDKEGQEKINNMVKQTDDGYEVTLGYKDTKVKVSNEDIANSQGINGNDKATAIEAAASKFMAENKDNPDFESKSGKLDGIGSTDSYKLLNGEETESESAQGADDIKQTLSELADKDQDGLTAIVGFKVNGDGDIQDLNSDGGMHGFNITGINKEEGTVTVHNPWNKDDSKDTTMSIDDFANKASSMSYIEA